MKIGIDGRFFGPESKGLGRYTQKLIEHLEGIDHDNEYVVFLRENNFDLYQPKNKNFTKAIADYKWYSLVEQIFWPRDLYRHNLDLMHFPHFNVPLFYRRKFVVTIHDLILLHFPTREASTRGGLVYQIKYWGYLLVIKNAVTAAEKIIAVSDFTKNDIVSQYGIDDEKVSVIYEAGNDERKKNLTPEESKSIIEGLGIERPFLLYVGNAYPHKNLQRLVDAFALWQNTYEPDRHARLVLVGRDDYFYKRLSEYIIQQNIQGIIILHTVDDHTLSALYEESEMFVFPSLYEGFGLPPLEACAHGTPVLCSHASCMPEILCDGAMYCDFKNVAKIAQGIDQVMEDAQLRRELGEEGLKRSKQFSWEKTAQETVELYKSLL